MLVLAPAACILSGIALSEAFDVLTRSIKFQLPGLSDRSQIDVSLVFFLHFSNTYIYNPLLSSISASGLRFSLCC